MQSTGLSRRSFLELCAAGALATGMPGTAAAQRLLAVDSPAGRRPIDAAGSPVGVARLDAGKSYAGVGELLQRFINDSDQAAWQAIKTRVDYTYEGLAVALGALEGETRFRGALGRRLKSGQKILFKPNIVGTLHIDPQTHGPGIGSAANTEWAFVAALMRWFHDTLDVSYHQMAVGEASTSMPAFAAMLTRVAGRPITAESAIEGRNGSFYGGWGFYFARKYLAESRKPGERDDPFSGYEESVKGVYLPPGRSGDRLMVYDLNRAGERARRVRVPNGVNFQSIALHKTIVGGDPADRADRAAYPGCVLVNVPKFKVHAISLFTNVIKNLGIGLYPMHADSGEEQNWEYSLPHGAIPGMKGGLPHTVWVSQMDRRTGVPRRDGSGRYMVRKTGGITATMIDVIEAVRDQDTLMVHVVDGIEAINFDHTGGGEKVAEGVVFAGLDPVATDLLCARYMFSNVPMKDRLSVDLDDGFGGHFPQRVPLPEVEQGEIVTRAGYDCPIARDPLLRGAERRGLGSARYYVVGRDVTAGAPLASIDGHLGRVGGGRFEDVRTETLYYDRFKMPWDLQKTAFAYFKAVDQLTGSTLMKAFLEEHDEDGDGVTTYDELGRRGAFEPVLFAGGRSLSMLGGEPFGFLKGPFLSAATTLRWSNPSWNAERHDILQPLSMAATAAAAFAMSRLPGDSVEPSGKPRHWGSGKWPGFEFARGARLMASLFGREYPSRLSPGSLYGLAFSFADLTQNGGRYSAEKDPIGAYLGAVDAGNAQPLDFVLYVPKELEAKLPNVVPTSEPAKILTASFASEREVWA